MGSRVGGGARKTPARADVTGARMPHGVVDLVDSRRDFDRFYGVLTSAPRRPVVVVTVAQGDQTPLIDIGVLQRELGDSVHLYVLSAAATFWLTDALGSKAATVHSGWARVYPSSASWRIEPHRAPSFRPVLSGRNPPEQRIVDAALDAAFKDGIAAFDEALVVGSKGSAVVTGLVSATQVLVRIDGGGAQALMRTNRLATGLSAERIVSVGQRFTGRVSPVGMLDEFTPDVVAFDQLQRAIDFVGEGVVTSVAVAGLTRDSVRLLLHPDVEIEIKAGIDEDPATLAREGDVVTVEIIRFENEFLATFSAEEPASAMSFLPEGPPWVVPQPVAVEPKPSAPVTPAVVEASVSAELARVTALEDELERLEQRHQHDEEMIRQLQRALRVTRKLSVPVVHRDPERQFRLELELDYLSRVEEPDRVRFPWPDRYQIGSGFLESLDRLVRDGGITREKVVSVCADVLCGRARVMTSRAVKEWRSSPNGSPLQRDTDGAAAMRVRLQTGANAARRMRYWLLTNGEVELDRVGVHDEGLVR